MFSVAIESSFSLQDVASIFSDPAIVDGPLYRESEAFTRQICAIAGEAPLVLHIDDLEATPGILVEWASRLRSRRPGFYVAFSGSRNATATNLPFPVRRIELSRLESREVRTVIDQRFKRNQLPDYLWGLLREYSEGWPSLIAAKMASLIDEGSVTCDVDDVWRLAKTATDEIIALRFRDSILDGFKRRLERTAGQWRPWIENTIRLAPPLRTRGSDRTLGRVPSSR